MEHTKTIELKRARWMRRKELKSLLLLLEELAGESGYVEMLLTTSTRTIHRPVKSEEVDSYLDELTKGEIVGGFSLTVWGGEGPLQKYVHLDLSSVAPKIKVSGADRTWVFGTADTLHEHLEKWDRPLIHFSLLNACSQWLLWTIGLAGAGVTYLLARLGVLHVREPFWVSWGIFVVLTIPPAFLALALLGRRPDLIRPISIDFYVPQDEERERARKWAERKEKLVWLLIGVVFTVVAELIGYWLLKKLGWL
ncbi:MAG: hypothetical protein MUP04_09485 [Anaerolineae bacterium]|nr:hypothetical protein [Anaerolineae bacterium]